MSATIEHSAKSAGVAHLEQPQLTSKSLNRIHYLDNLRALAMLLGVYLHGALAYAYPAQSVWLATDPQASVTVDVSIWFIHLFRMGLFFLLSGYFAKLVIDRKGVKQFLWNRCVRIVAPFLLFYPFLLASMTVVFIFALSYLDEPRGLMGLVASAIKDSSATKKPQPLTTMHLWFLYYLIGFSTMGVLLHRVSFFHWDKLLRRPRLLLFSPMLLVPGAMYAGSPLPAPESFIPDWWPFAFYGFFFFAGWQWFGKERWIDGLLPYTWHILGISIVLFVPYYLLLPELNLNQLADEMSATRVGMTWTHALEAILAAYLSVMLTIVALLVGHRFLAKRSPILSFVSDSSYWTYLIHLPIVLFLQNLLIPVALPLWLKLAIVLAGTSIPCLATYVVFVRYTPLGWLLHGKRSFP
jgi:glucans biosynthesis protein C